MRHTTPVTMPKVSGVTQSARSQPGCVKRRMPRAGGFGGACCSTSWCSTATAIRVVPTLLAGDLLEVHNERVDLLGGQRLSEVLRHHVGWVPGRDDGVRIDDRVQNVLLAHVRDDLIQVRPGRTRRAGGRERVTRAAVLDEERLGIRSLLRLRVPL